LLDRTMGAVVGAMFAVHPVRIDSALSATDSLR
jgi:hypothetical protein